MKDITLVILAAGMGSRFGGLKQVAPLGPNDEFIIDYSIYDAIKAGFNKVVFIIKEENYDIFKETIGLRVESHVKVEYVFQNNNNIPKEYDIPKDRVKPLGTAHAILCAKEKINEPFAIINADDFYGRDAFIKAADFLMHTNDNHFGMIGYDVNKTMTENGSVKRGVCEVNDNKLVSIIESKVERVNNDIIATPLDGRTPFKVSEDATVSMNLLLFTPIIFTYIEDGLVSFLEANKNDLSTCEYLIPDVLFDSIKKGSTVSVIPTTATWYGVTYKEDSAYVKQSLKALVDNKEYNTNLWSSNE